MRQQEKRDDAVSPVIGIMLMLVVTIIIAAVITGFATDLSKDTDKAPTVLFDVQYENDKIMLKHKGGDPIRLQDMQMVIEQRGGMAYGGGVSSNEIIHTVSGTDGKFKIRGDDTAKSASTGDVILVDCPVDSGVALWTLTYVPTNGLIASGEIVIS